MSRRCRHDPQWREKYAEMVVSAEEAVARLSPGRRVFVGTGCGVPLVLVRALAARAEELPDTEVIHLLALGEAPYAQRELVRYFRVNSFFIAENVRGLIQEGLGDYTPIFLSDIPRLFHSGRLPLDAALIQVTPPDERGRCSLGVSVDIVKSAAENAALVIAQVNPRMPRTHGDSHLHVYDLDLLVPGDEPILETTYADEREETRRIAEYVAALIDHGATLEVGIGRIPQSLLGFLGDKKELGIHTEMITDGIVDLVASGVVTGSRKSLDRGKVVASFCLGSEKLYDAIDDDPTYAFHPTEYVNDPFVISRHHRMVAINVALEVDLTGQVCSDSLGSRFFSGVGGQVDFNRGAARARDGRAIIALPSTARDGTVSRIVARLTPGAGVVTTRADVHYVVTEHGAAYLHGKSVSERALALIAIAHPEFRGELLEAAIENRYLSPELADLEDGIVVGPKELRTTMLLADGTQITFRPIHPTDEPRMRQLFYQLSQQTIQYRFMSDLRHIPRKQVREFVFIDHRNDIAIVGTVPEAHGDEIIAIGRYYLDLTTNLAEVAFVVHDDWQGKGIGTFLFRHLAEVARRNGIRGFTAEVLAANRGMQAVFERSDCKVSSRLEGGVISYRLELE